MGAFAQKKPSQLPKWSDRMPTARLPEGEQAHAAAGEQRLECAPGVKHDHRNLMAATRQPCSEQSELALTAADHEIASEEEDFHGVAVSSIGLRG
jgi:hypothetical protein